ncbi:hypothetical protein JCM19000A_42500 [Silvimonas sp. JCM 19000]
MEAIVALYQQIEKIDSKDDLADFIAALKQDLESNAEEWENPTLERFLSAMEEWTRSMDNYYRNTGQQPPQVPTWRTLANILYASKMYE